MTDGSQFVLDANVFIEAANRYYAFDLVPSFWQVLVQLSEHGRVRSIDRVQEELDKGKDELKEWANGNFGNAFASTDDVTVFESFGEIMEWVQENPQFSEEAKSSFASGADGWLIAAARVNGYVIVTQEVLVPETRRRVPIPNVCEAFDVHYVDTFEMLRSLGVQFRR